MKINFCNLALENYSCETIKYLHEEKGRNWSDKYQKIINDHKKKNGVFFPSMLDCIEYINKHIDCTGYCRLKN